MLKTQPKIQPNRPPFITIDRSTHHLRVENIFIFLSGCVKTCEDKGFSTIFPKDAKTHAVFISISRGSIRQDGRHPNKTKELVVPKTACAMSYCQRDIPRVKHASITSTTKKKKKKKKRKRRIEGGKVSLVSIARRRWRR